MKKTLLRTMVLVTCLMLFSQCNKAEEIIDALTQGYTETNLRGTWTVTEATVTVWGENQGIIAEETDTNILGAIMVFNGSTVRITSGNQEFTYGYDTDIPNEVLSLEINSTTDDVFDVVSFVLPVMRIENRQPEDGDYEFSSTLNMNIYNQKKITMVKQ